MVERQTDTEWKRIWKEA